MEQHNDFCISGTAVPGPPNTDYWSPAGAVLLQRDNGSVVELVRFNLESFDLADQGVAELFGLELARLVVDINYAELLRLSSADKQRQPDRPTQRRPYRSR